MKQVNLNIRIPKELKEEFYEVAESKAQVPSGLIRLWIKKYIEESK